MSRIAIICKQCKKEFKVPFYRKDTARFCSNKCHGEWNSENRVEKNNPSWKGGKVTLICQQCGKEYKVSFHRKEISKFCSKKCKNKWMSENQTGKNNPSWNGGGVKVICKQCGKEYLVKSKEKERTKFCSKKCQSKWMSENQTGKNNPNWKGGKVVVICGYCEEEYLIKPNWKNTSKFCSRECKEKWMSENRKGKNHPNWKGGITSLQDSIRKSKKYKEFIQKVLKKANYICQLSNQIGGDLQIHHIKGFAKILEENNITTLEKALECEELWNEKNVVVLSEKCHLGVKTDNPYAFHRLYGKHNFTEQDFNEWYNEFKGKCG